MDTEARAFARPTSESALPSAKPFVKWVGGKGRLMSQLAPLLPAGVEGMRHVEPFLGGGAMFFARGPRRALLSDINPELVHTYLCVRDDVDGVIAELAALAAAGHASATYYAVRERYNAGDGRDTPLRAALFLYLNRTCFNGLHRLNQLGRFNVPIGRYKNPTILDEGRLRAASAALRNADIRCVSFEAHLKTVGAGDFVYLDPPYHPRSATSSFTQYARAGFGAEDQVRLRDVFVALHRRGARLMLTNSDLPFIRDLYGGFRMASVHAARAVSARPGGRAEVPDLVVCGYCQ